MKVSDCFVGLKVRVNKNNPHAADLLKGDFVQITNFRNSNYIEVREFSTTGELLTSPTWAVELGDLDLIEEPTTLKFDGIGEVHDSKWYIKNAIKTDLPDYAPVCERLQDKKTVRILHAAMGLTTEAGEVMDALKKHLMYGKPLDTVNLKEEVADSMWYMAILADTLGFEFEEVMKTNIAKLKARYGEKFTEEAALNRNLDGERKILEGDSK
jgi:NTP pyrophosphatase (non-canonical NTP hydrolase)